MRETKITVRVNESKEDIFTVLDNLGFKVIRHTIMTDDYFSKFSTEELKKMKYSDIIRNSFLLRKFEGDVNKCILHYKDKEFDEDGNVISEEKLTEPVSDIDNLVKIFILSKLNNWCHISQDMYIYNKDNMEFAVQIVDGLGIFIEYEEDESVAGLATEEKISQMLGKIKNLGFDIGDDYSVKKVYEKFLIDNRMIIDK